MIGYKYPTSKTKNINTYSRHIMLIFILGHYWNRFTPFNAQKTPFSQPAQFCLYLYLKKICLNSSF